MIAVAGGVTNAIDVSKNVALHDFKLAALAEGYFFS
jgi:hypothetical protein